MKQLFLCYCPICENEHKYPMEPEEYKDLVSMKDEAGLGLKNLTDEGRLMLACDECNPMKYSSFLSDL